MERFRTGGRAGESFIFSDFSIKKPSRLLRVNAAEIARRNLFILKILSALMTAVLLCSAVSCLCFPPREYSRFTGYIVFSGISLLVFLCCFFVFKKHQRFIPSGIIIIEVIYMLLSLVMDIYYKHDRQGTVFFIVIVVCAFLFVVYPLYLDISLTSFCTIYCILALVFKRGEIVTADLINCIGMSVAGIIVGTITNNVKLREMETRRLLILQRDTDVLTGLPNRRKLFSTLAEYESGSRSGKLTGVIMVDIDYFKQYNDTFGHQAGDDCLREISSCLNCDLSGGTLRFYRFGGEEFLALATDCAYETLAEAAALIVEKTAARDIAAGDYTPYGKVTVSAGYAHIDNCTSSGYETLIHFADKALYEAKQSGRNTVRACGAELK